MQDIPIHDMIAVKQTNELLSYYKQLKNEIKATIQPRTIEEYQRKCRLNNFSMADGMSFKQRYPNYSDYWNECIKNCFELNVIEKIIDSLERHKFHLFKELNESLCQEE